MSRNPGSDDSKRASEDALPQFDPDNEVQALRAALDCMNAADALLRDAEFQRVGTVFREVEVIRILYDLDTAIANAWNYSACLLASRNDPRVKATKLAERIRAAWIRAGNDWRHDDNWILDGWVCLRQLYETHFGNPPDHEEIEYRWHFDAWPYVCERLAAIPRESVREVIRELLTLKGSFEEEKGEHESRDSKPESLRVNTDTGEIEYRDELLPLGTAKKGFWVFAELEDRWGKYVSVDRLLEVVWRGDRMARKREVQAAITHLRKHLKVEPFSQLKVDGRSKPGFYRLHL